MRRAKTPFARCPCTKTAICAGAVNHPHHINCMNHSSNKCQPALVHALIPVNPSIRRKRASSAARTFCRLAPKFLAQSHTISRKLSSNARTSLRYVDISKHWTKRRLLQVACWQESRLRFARCPCTKTAICAAAVNHPHHINHVNHSSDKCQRALVHALIPVNPSIRRKRASSPARTRPPRPRARPSPAARLPCCAQNFLPNLTHSLVISRVTLVHLPCLSTPPSAAKMLLTSIPFETGTLPANATTVSWPSRLPLRNTKYAIQRPTCSVPLAGA